MNTDDSGSVVAGTRARYRAGLTSRRHLVGILGTLGIGATAAGVVGRDRGRRASAAASGVHVTHQTFDLRQAGTPSAEVPLPPATPQLGPRPDGSTTWKVISGEEVIDETGVIELEAFFPRQITVTAGDRVFFDNHGFHNVHFYPSGQRLEPLFVSETTTGAAPIAAASPAAGAPRIVLNPAVAFPSEGMTVDGATEVNSGLPLGEPAPIVITFSTPGTYEYWCDPHADLVMKGVVVVQEAGTAAPLDQGGVDQAAQAEMESLRAQVRELIAAQIAMAGTPMAGISTARGTVHEITVGLSAIEIEINTFFPRNLTVTTGDTVRFVYTAADPLVRHTVSFAGDGAVPDTFLIEDGESGPPAIVLNPLYVESAGGPTYSGQGFINSGMFGENPDIPPVYEVTFDTPGSYDYYSAIHGSPGEGMAGAITVV